MSRDVETRALTKVVRLEAIADVLIASDMAIPAIKALLTSVSAYCDADALYAGIMPTMPALDDPGLPAAVRDAARDAVRRAYAAANMHRAPHGLPS